jgi:cytochrome b
MKSYIWALPTRIFHWLLAISFTIAYILSDFENLINLHFAFGALVGTLIIFRLVYGIIGPKYSQFKDFPMGITNQIEFLKNLKSRMNLYAGHNPAASVIMILILLVGLCCSLSGYSLYSAENGNMIFGMNEEFLEEAHEILANTFLVLVGIHLLGIITDTIIHKSNSSLISIFTGYKNVNATNVQLNAFQKIFSVLWFIVPLLMFIYANGFVINENKEGKTKIEKSEDDD